MATFSLLKWAKTPKTDCEVVTFSRLDYWSMLDLFDRIPVHDLVRLNGLASWWSGYVTKVCRTKRDITVQCGHKDRFPTADHTPDQFNLLKVTRIRSHTSDRLGHLLPSITSLEIIIKGFERYDIADITYLIRKWSHQLVSLKIKCNSYYSCKRKMKIKQLLLSLNTITSLRRLTIDCKRWKFSPMQEAIDLPILSRMEYIYFYTGDNDFDILRESLVRYAGPNHHLKQIELPSLDWTLPLNDLFGEHQLLSKLTMLKFDFRNPFTRVQWALFTNLATVDLEIIPSRSGFMEIISGMQSLKLIRNLKMYIMNFDIFPNYDRDLDQARIDALINLPQLSSVTNLELSIDAYWHTNSYPTNQIKSLQLGTIFPNLESVHLDYTFTRMSNSSSYRVVKWTNKIWRKIGYQMFKLRVQREFAGVECTFKEYYF